MPRRNSAICLLAAHMLGGMLPTDSVVIGMHTLKVHVVILAMQMNAVRQTGAAHSGSCNKVTE